MNASDKTVDRAASSFIGSTRLGAVSVCHAGHHDTDSFVGNLAVQRIINWSQALHAGFFRGSFDLADFARWNPTARVGYLPLADVGVEITERRRNGAAHPLGYLFDAESVVEQRKRLC